MNEQMNTGQRQRTATDEAVSQQIRAKAAEALHFSPGIGSGIGGLHAARTSLRDSVAMQAEEARRQSRKAERMEELAFLLEKNPEVARILDLLDEVRR